MPRFPISPDFVVKADSEGQPGPSHYGRTPADAANMLAAALKPHGGVVLYRAFVYNHHMDWNNLKNDRARAAYDNFHPLDGQFADNVIVQIKNGPIDFQVREPVSPLFAGAAAKPMRPSSCRSPRNTWARRGISSFCPPSGRPISTSICAPITGHRSLKAMVAGKTFHRPLGGYVGVANVGLDANWMGSHLSMANLYGFGRLAWNPEHYGRDDRDEWTRLTFSNDPKVVATVTRMLLSSWRIYENYTGPLGLQTLTNITGPHYGPAPQSQENNGWGQWIRADHDGVGMDRTVATGTGFIGQYPPEVAAHVRVAQDLPRRSAPLHASRAVHLPAAHRQNRHPDHLRRCITRGRKKQQDWCAQWQTLDGLIDPERVQRHLALLEYQAGHAIVWRDAINRWFEKMSGIPDDQRPHRSRSQPHHRLADAARWLHTHRT